MNHSIFFILEIGLGLMILILMSPFLGFTIWILVLSIFFLSLEKNTERQVLTIFTTAMLLAINALVILL
ncbi:hypothetical protein [Chroococcus sp. FPU101]|uniref:hypothetical protein n=1 Tax=Chroococcus sp. FPU101 TaxID=1974212 RepID=UPI001A903D72|nr:hypothetical protein [Chroococcus sp. FPU101]GFE71854.1 hypothetical protein CFPU101_44640 [Chroococcus sp. FPU101]